MCEDVSSFSYEPANPLRRHGVGGGAVTCRACVHPEPITGGAAKGHWIEPVVLVPRMQIAGLPKSNPAIQMK